MPQTALVTGSSRGIGLAIAERLVTRGCSVVLVGRDPVRLSTAQDRFTSAGVDALVVACDLASPGSTDRILAAVRGRGWHVDILVNAAAVVGPVGYMSRSRPDEWARTIEIDFLAAVRLSLAVVPGMLRRGRGRIINVASAQILYPPDPVVSAYATGKAALAYASRALAAEVAARQAGDVSVCVIHPGDVRSAMWSQLSERAMALGDEGQPMREWAARVAETGGDSPTLAADLVADICDRPAHQTNGRFLQVEGVVPHPPSTW